MFDLIGTARAVATAAVIALGATLGAGTAQATTINTTTYDGNDCAGIFGGTQGSVCEDPVYNSPILFKVNFEEDDAGATWGTDGEGNIIALNPVWQANYVSFPTLPDLTEIASWFTFDFTADEGRTGTWTYSGPDVFGTTSWVAKGSNAFTHYWTEPQTVVTSGSWSIEKGLSHLSFYDTIAPIPLPAAGWLLIGGLGALVAVRRRKRAA